MNIEEFGKRIEETKVGEPGSDRLMLGLLSFATNSFKNIDHGQFVDDYFILDIYREAIPGLVELIIVASNGGHHRDALMLWRALYERLVTFQFLCECDEKYRDRYIAYAMQKNVKLRDYVISQGKVKLASVVDWQKIRQDATMAQSLDLYTSQNGRDHNRWAKDLGFDKINEAVVEGRGRLGFVYRMMHNDVYALGSEVAHSTFIGLYSLGGCLESFLEQDGQKLEAWTTSKLAMRALMFSRIVIEASLLAVDRMAVQDPNHTAAVNGLEDLWLMILESQGKKIDPNSV